MTCPAANSDCVPLTAGTRVVFTTTGVDFSATIMEAATGDRLLVNIHEASDPRFAARLPKRLWLENLTSRLRLRTLRIVGPIRQPGFSPRTFAA